MNVEQEARNALVGLVASKRDACRREGGPADLQQMIVVHWRDGKRAIGVWHGDRDDIPAVVTALREEHPGEVTALVHLADAFTREVHDDYDIDTDRGRLTEEFQRGDMRVKETLVATALDAKTGEMGEAMQGYTFRDDGSVKFGPVTSTVHDQDACRIEGAVVDRMKEALA